MTVIIATVLSAPAAATAQVLPMLVEEGLDGEVGFWWAADPAQPAGPADHALFDAAAHSSTWLSPSEVTPQGSISRIYRVAELPATNARNVAGLFGAAWLCFGQTRWQSGDGVPWLGLRGVSVELDAHLIAVDTGTEVAHFEVTFRGLGGSDDDAAAEAASAMVRYLDTQLAALTYGGGEIGDGSTQRIVVVGSGVAAPYVGFRRGLREELPGVIDITEAWASEGRIALDLALEAETTFESVAEALVALEGHLVGGVTLDAVAREEGIVFVELSETAPVDAP